MQTRSVINPIRSFCRAAALTLAIAGPLVADAPETVKELSLDQGLHVAVASLKQGKPEITLQLSRGLLQADPKNPMLHYLQANAYAGLGKPVDARQSAARAYRYADRSEDKFQAAQLAARSALQADSPTLAQYWLRLTAIHSPDEIADQRIAQDYLALRRINPWSFRIRTEIKPSDNVNNGADSALQIIDGDPVIGRLNGAAQALSGVIGVVDLSSAYRFRQSAESETSVAGRLYIQRVSLSSEAKAQAPNVTGSDFASTYGELSLRHAMAVGSGDTKGIAIFEGTLGTSWYGDERSYNLARLDASRSWTLGKSRLEISGLAETRFSARYATNDANIIGLGAQISRALSNGDRLTLSMAYRDTNAVGTNGTFWSASMRANYAFAKPLGPARLSAALTLGYSDYPTYQLFLPSKGGIGPVQGGRQDSSIYGDLNFFFDQYDYAGFAPVLRIRTGQKDSNISRFDIRESSISLGIQSKF